MKGKHAKMANKRRDERSAAKLDDLRAECADLRDELHRTRARLVEQDVLRAEIDRLRGQVADGTSDALEAATDRMWELIRDQRDARRFLDVVREDNERVHEQCIQLLGGTREAVLALTCLVTGKSEWGIPTFVDPTKDYLQGLPPNVVEMIQRKRAKNDLRRRLKPGTTEITAEMWRKMGVIWPKIENPGAGCLRRHCDCDKASGAQ